MNVRKLIFCNDIFSNVTESIDLVLDKKKINALEEFTNEWKDKVSQLTLEEETFIAQKYNIPSFLVRVDCVWQPDGSLFVYEIEDAPAGAYLVKRISTQYSYLLNYFQEQWPKFKAFLSPKKRFSDVILWVGPSFSEYSGYLWNIIRPEEADEFSSLIPRSVTPVRNEGNKLPIAILTGAIVGRPSDVVNRIDRKKSWVFKPIQGTRSFGIRVFWGESDPLKKPKDGIKNINKILKDMQKIGGEWMAQPFVRPAYMADYFNVDDAYKKYWFIYRVYLAYFIKDKRYYLIGGTGCALDRAVVHGTDKSLFFPITIPYKFEDDILRRF